MLLKSGWLAGIEVLTGELTVSAIGTCTVSGRMDDEAESAPLPEATGDIFSPSTQQGCFAGQFILDPTEAG